MRKIDTAVWTGSRRTVGRLRHRESHCSRHGLSWSWSSDGDEADRLTVRR